MPTGAPLSSLQRIFATTLRETSHLVDPHTAVGLAVAEKETRDPRLPMIVLGTVPLAVIARMTRSSMLEVLEEDYVRTARAKGLSWTRVVGVHALRNALIPVVTVIGEDCQSARVGRSTRS